MSSSKPAALANVLYIVLGFGGTGGKTIAEMAKIATHDPVAAQLVRERVHVILCDTDVGELNKAYKDVIDEFSQRVPGGPPPIEMFQLGLGSDIFQDLVQARFEDAKRIDEEAQKAGKDGGAVRALREHWWFDAKGQPFSAHRMPMSINAGAAQCPMVSHFLAWDSLRRLENVLQDVANRAMNERGMENFTVELYLVSSFAGGTGRGCWQLLSLKAREFFGARGQSCRPTGFFLDASAFGEVMRNRPDQRIKLEVNSLTGMSELAMWLRDPEEPEKKFVLPDLKNPADEQVAVINTENFMPEEQVARRGRNPVHKAFVFTAQSDSLSLEKTKDVYQACAAALYGRLSLTQTRSADANSPARAAVTATSVLFVPVSDIRQVVRISAKAARARRFLEGETEKSESSGRKHWERMAEVKDPPGQPLEYKVTDGTKSADLVKDLTGWLGKVFCQFPETARGFVSKKASGKKELTEKSLLEHIVDLRSVERSTILKGIETQLKKCVKMGSKKGAQDLKRYVEEQGKGDQSMAAQMFWTAACEVLGREVKAPKADAKKTADLPTRLKQEFENAFSSVFIYGGIPGYGAGDPLCLATLGGRDPKIGSPAVLGAALNQVKELLDSTLKKLRDAREKAEPKKAEGEPNDLEEIVEKFSISLRFWAKIPVLGSLFSPFTAADLEEIQDLVYARVSTKVYVQVLQDYKLLLESIQARLAAIQSRTEVFVSTVLKMANKYDEKAKKDSEESFTILGGDKHSVADRMEQMRRMLQKMEEENTNPISRIVRKLRPIFSAEDYRRAVQSAIARTNSEATEESLWLEKLLTEPKGDSDSAQIFAGSLRGVSEISKFEKKISSGLEGILEGQTIDDDALVKQFRLVTVIENLLAAWIDAYLATGSEDLKLRVSKALEDCIGIDIGALKKAGEDQEKASGLGASGRISMPEAMDILIGASIRMAQKCDPLVRFGADSGYRGDTVTVFLPNLGGSDRLGEEVANRIRKAVRDQKETLHHVSIDTKSRNPFMLVVMSDTPKADFDERLWDGWDSFSYWRKDHAVKRWLLKAETTSGDSVFCNDDDSVGQGYLSPQYVRNPYFASRRWKPWVDGRQSDQKWRALAYALIGNNLYRTAKEEQPNAATHPWWPLYQKFKTVVSGLKINPDAPTERLTLPLLLEEPGGKGPSFQRTLLKDENGKLRLTGEKLGPDGGQSFQFTSVRKFIRWFRGAAESKEVLSSDTVFSGVWNEFELLCDYLRHPERSSDPEQAERIHEICSPEVAKAVNAFVREYVREMKDYIVKSSLGEEDKAEQRAFLEEFEKVITKPEFDILSLLKSDKTAGR
jgi:hypothetical protein